MSIRSLFIPALSLSVLLQPTPAQELKPIALPQPQTVGGRPLMQALRDRKSTREFSREPLSLQTLSNLLWAGFGINRPETGHRTAPSAMNSQEVALYVALAEGLFFYDATAHQLQPVLAKDIRAQTGSQPFVREAPVSIIFVADLARLTKAKPGEREFYAGIDTGFISQNIYLYCASEGLATVVHAVDHAVLGRAMPLRPEQKVILAQAVGHPKR
ncbi:MAG: SagB/ThcOx family dehydrogenase [Verrucomicrobiae bacterium]|nr:SagB/ThcOx family dehydrogenase [Verrucomicrobiae bacterium]